jgi:lipoprotein-anchoring transpeptidase ErfK/SrfK
MTEKLSRRDFLKLGGAALGGLALVPAWPRPQESDSGTLGRITVKEIPLRSAPNDTAPIIGQRFRDQLVHIYAELHPADAPQYYNTLWYRVWGGYLHSSHIQIVQNRPNMPVSALPESGQLVEVTVPYSDALQYNRNGEWSPWRGNRLYYETIHWATGVQEGPDGRPWYQITSELSKTEKYYVLGEHLRPIAAEEYSPLSPDLPMEKKRVEVSIGEQTMRAFEDEQLVMETRISSGLPNPRLSPGDLPTATPKGRFNIYAKLPTKHMGSMTGNPDSDEGSSFSLPGVPWTCFFAQGGYAFHGTFWHNNFGLQMSHGCINMRNADAKWLFRWTTPVFASKIESPEDWERTGFGTRIDIF